MFAPRRSSALVKRWRARVRPGDDLGAIAKRFGPGVDAWPALVAANPQKRLGRCPRGSALRGFESLRAGEELFVPAHWPDPPVGVGQGPSIDQWAVFEAAFMNLVGSLLEPSGVEVPRPRQIAAVLWSWWPYLYEAADRKGLNWPTPFQMTNFFADPALRDALTELVWSAKRFLEAVGPVPPEVLQRVPWDRVPWDMVPWDAIREAFPFGQQAGFWELMRRRVPETGPIQIPRQPGLQRRPEPGPQPPLASLQVPAGTNPELIKGVENLVSFIGAQASSTGQQASGLSEADRDSLSERAGQFGKSGETDLEKRAEGVAPEPGQDGYFGDVLGSGSGVGVQAGPEMPALPDFFGSTWEALKDVGWLDVPWANVSWLQFTDPEFRACVADPENKPRLRQMVDDCPDCWTDATIDEIKAVVCDKTAATCPCKAEPPPEPPPEPPKEPPDGPPGPSEPNWGCKPFPDCLAQPGNWPSNVEQPCQPFPDCIPQWIRDKGGSVPGEQAEKDEGDGTIYWVIGGGIVLVGAIGLAAILMRPKAAPAPGPFGGEAAVVFHDGDRVRVWDAAGNRYVRGVVMSVEDYPLLDVQLVGQVPAGWERRGQVQADIVKPGWRA